MIGSSTVKTRRDLFLLLLSDFIDMTHERVLLGDAIDWDYFQRESPVFWFRAIGHANLVYGRLTVA